MIRKVPSPKADCVRVIFELPACIWADRIFLVGDFNEWNTTVSPFIQSRDGVWRVMLDLPAGRDYEFRYLVDGDWQTDFHADGWTVNEYGSQNSVVSAILPPESLPQLGGSGLLREEFGEPGHFYRTFQSLSSAPRTASTTPRQYFSSPAKAAG